MTEKLKKIVGPEGSITFYNNEFKDTYHSVTVSAFDEARVKYVEPAKLKEGDKVLDFCFGLGYNSLLAIHTVKNLEVTGIELDKDILKEITNIEIESEYKESYSKIQKAVMDAFNKRMNKHIKLIIGDGIEESKKLDYAYFDAVLFDPFSPKKHPELWSEEVFKEMYRVLKGGGRLTTYSCAGFVRENLKKAGFEVIDGPSFGRRAPSTIAIKN